MKQFKVTVWRVESEQKEFIVSALDAHDARDVAEQEAMNTVYNNPDESEYIVDPPEEIK